MTHAARPDPARTISTNSQAGSSHGPDPGRPGSARLGAARPVPQRAVISAGLTPVLLAAAWLAADALQPSSYSPIRQTVSVLAGYGGTDRWIVTGALFLVGGCHFVTAAGLSGVRVSARLLLVVAGLSSIGIAASPEPVHGSTAQHVAWAVLGAAAIAVWPAFVARRAPARPLILNLYCSAAVTAVFVALLGWLFIQTQGGSDLGLAERLTSGVETSWPFIVAVALRRTAALRTPTAPHATSPDSSNAARRVGCRP
jgi:Protein of unknown function (DUF998)